MARVFLSLFSKKILGFFTFLLDRRKYREYLHQHNIVPS